MSILIEGMTKEDFFRILLGANCGMFQKENLTSYYGHKVIELPPHGRLIDADAYLEKLMDTVNECVKKGVEIEAFRYFIEGAEAALVDAMTMLNNMPTIIEAEVEGK